MDAAMWAQVEAHGRQMSMSAGGMQQQQLYHQEQHYHAMTAPGGFHIDGLNKSEEEFLRRSFQMSNSLSMSGASDIQQRINLERSQTTGHLGQQHPGHGHGHHPNTVPSPTLAFQPVQNDGNLMEVMKEVSARREVRVWLDRGRVCRYLDFSP